MPYYEYYCDANDTLVEVRHPMSEELGTWGEVCDRSGRDPGTTPPDTRVERRMSLPVPTPATAAGRSGPEPCGPGCGCVLSA